MTREEIMLRAFADVLKKRRTNESTQLVKAVGDVMSERLGQMQAARVLPAPNVTNEIAVPSVEVHNESLPPTVSVYNDVQTPTITNEIGVPSVDVKVAVDMQPVADVVRQLLAMPDLPTPQVTVNVDMQPIATALERLAEAVLKQGQMNAAMATEQAEMMKQLIQALASRPAIEFKPVVNVPKVEVPPINIEPIAKAISGLAVERPKRTFTIKHDERESTVTEE